MLPALRWVLSSLLTTMGALSAQTRVEPGILAGKTSPSFALPDQKPKPRIASPAAAQAGAKDKPALPGFLKGLTLTSFGYSLKPTGPGFESPFSISAIHLMRRIPNVPLVSTARKSNTFAFRFRRSAHR